MIKDIIEIFLIGVAFSCIIFIILIGYSLFKDKGKNK